MAATIIDKEIERPTPTVFRRAYIKRRLNTTGKYESSWQNISNYVKRWGTFDITIDDVRLNRFTESDLTLIVRNDEGKFNPENSQSSLWYGYLTRYRTLIKIDAGYVQDDGVEIPTSSTQGLFLLDGEIKINSVSNEASLHCLGLTQMFKDMDASQVTGIINTLTASEVVAKIRDHTDGATNFIFREILTSTSWSIQATTNPFYFNTTTALQGTSVWDLMNMLAEAEGYVLSLKRDGSFEFRDRTARTTTSQFSLYGEGFPRPNVIQMNWRIEAIDKYFSMIRVKYLQPDTTASFRQYGTTTVIDSSSTAWKYGLKELEFENIYISDTATADAIIANLYNSFAVMKQEIEVVTKFIPHLEISDRVDLNWNSYGIASRRWDLEDWASDAAAAQFDGLSWDPETGENFDLNAFNMKILSKKTNLDDFTTTFILREI